jgi:hypothetical protein
VLCRPACGPAPDNEAQMACFYERIRLTVQYAVYDAMVVFEAEKASVMIWDVTFNTGGYVWLGFHVMLALSKHLHYNGDIVAGTYDLRYSPLYDSILQFLAENPDVDDAYPYMTGLILTETGNYVDRSDTSWYSTGRTTAQAAGQIRVSKPFALYDVYNMTTAVPRVTLDASNLVLITDGLCGSMCAQFLTVLHSNGLARVVQMGGLLGLPGNTNSFAGGGVADLDELADGMASFVDAGWVPPKPIIRSFDTTASFSMNLETRHSTRSISKYLQFDPRPADLHVYAWGDTSTDAMSELLLSAVSAVPGIKDTRPFAEWKLRRIDAN